MDHILCPVIIVQGVSLCKGVHVFASQMSSEPLCRSQEAQTGGLSNRVTHERFHSSSLFTGDKGPGRVTHCNAHKWTHMISICKNVHITKSIQATAESWSLKSWRTQTIKDASRFDYSSRRGIPKWKQISAPVFVYLGMFEECWILFLLTGKWKTWIKQWGILTTVESVFTNY